MEATIGSAFPGPRLLDLVADVHVPSRRLREILTSLHAPGPSVKPPPPADRSTGLDQENEMTRARISAALLCALVTAAHADEILFNNGDRLTGTSVTADGGKITIKTAVAGEVKVDMKDVKTFTTDAPI